MDSNEFDKAVSAIAAHIDRRDRRIAELEELNAEAISHLKNHVHGPLTSWALQASKEFLIQVERKAVTK